MQTQEIIKTDLEVANDKLFVLKSSITSDDKQKLYAKKGMNPATLSKYLNKKGADLGTAMMLIEFFSNCITERRRTLAAV